jgi:CheY-like chemotaxis protein
MQPFHSAHTHSVVLVIEPDPLMLTAMAAVLDMQGHRALLARSETVAAEAIAAQAIDLIVLSIDQLDAGTAYAARLRQIPATRDVPIIFLTPELSPAWTAQLQAQGGVFCLLKPIDPHSLLELVEKTLWMPHLAQRRVQPPTAHFHKTADWVRLQD